ncbi:MAG: TetR/AcrR family transcriptional regulator [Solirubrobacteraceae bacterium]
MPRGQFDRSERRARTRVQLLAAAARVYARRGFDRATLDEVAEEAGFTKGAVYDHFGSKENLLVALLDEHLTQQIAEQVALFDPAKDTAERPRAGADRWMTDLKQDPDVFRLFVELWTHAQRDERLRRRLVSGMRALRETFRGFAAARSVNGGVIPTGESAEQFANIMLALATGIGMIELVDPDSVHPRLLGAVLALLIGTLESSEEARAVLADAARKPAGS